MPKIKNRELREFINPLLSSGWNLSRGKKHYKLTAPNGRLVVISITPSDYFAVKNIIADINRVKRGL